MTRTMAKLAAIAVLSALAAVPAAAAPLPVVATFSVLGDLVHQVGGDDIALVALVPPGGDAHVYQPRPGDAKAVAAARVVVVNGLGMEGWLDRMIAASGTRATVVVASRGVAARTMAAEGERTPSASATVADPHAWQDVANARIYVRNIAAGLAAADPAHASDYLRRAAAYDRQLADLDAWVRREIVKVPPAKRKIITTHDAFGYFGAAYGVSFLAPEGISTESEPTAAGLGRLAAQVRREHIRALFVETMSDPRVMRTLAEESGAVLGGAVYSDSLSPPTGPAPTYVAMFRHNVPAFVAAMLQN